MCSCPKSSLSILIGQETLLFYILGFELVERNWYPGLLIGGDVFFSMIALERRDDVLYAQQEISKFLDAQEVATHFI